MAMKGKGLTLPEGEVVAISNIPINIDEAFTGICVHKDNSNTCLRRNCLNIGAVKTV